MSIGDNSLWVLKARRSYSAEFIPPPTPFKYPYIPIPQDSVNVNRTILAVGCISAAPNLKPNWFLGCRVFLGNGAPTMGSEFANYEQYSRRVPCGLKRLTYCYFPNLKLSTYKLYIDFPKWLTSVSIEIFEYLGDPSDIGSSSVDGGTYP